MRWSAFGLLCLGLIFTSTGCQAPLKRSVLEVDTFLRAKTETSRDDYPPLHYRVAVAPVEQGYEGDTFLADSDPEAALYGEAVDPGQIYRMPITEETNLQREVVTALQALGMFDVVDPFTGARQVNTGVERLPEAAEREYDFLIVPRVKRNLVAYTGSNDAWWWPGLFGWIFLWVPTYFVPDETFESDVEVELVVYHVRSGVDVFRNTYTGSAQAAVSDVDMGFIASFLWSAVTVRAFGHSWAVLHSGNYENVSSVVTIPAMAAALGKFSEQFARDFPAVLGSQDIIEAMQGAEPNRYAILVGISHYDDPLLNAGYDDGGATSYASADARAIYEFLRNDAGFKLNNLELLDDSRETGAPTRENIENAILRRRNALDDDLVLIYLAGRTALDCPVEYTQGTDPFRKFFLPSDARASDLEASALEIGRNGSDEDGLIQLVDKIQSKRVVIILDTTFGRQSFMKRDLFAQLDADGDGVLSATESPYLTSQFLEDFAATSPRAVLVAADFNESLMQIKLIDRGGYAYHFEEGAKRVGLDQNLLELHEDYVKKMIIRQSRFVNQPQQPVHYDRYEILEMVHPFREDFLDGPGQR